MNTDQLKGKWKQLKGSMQRKWGEITDDQWEQAAGEKDKLEGLLQEKYGMSKEKAEEALHKVIDREDAADKFESVWNNVQGGWSEMVGSFKEVYGKATDDELTQSQGKRDHLAGMIQREYNVSRGEAYEMVDDWAYGSMKSSHLAGGKR